MSSINDGGKQGQGSDSVLLARIDERLVGLEKMVHSVKNSVESKYVTVQEFTPIKRFYYGVVTFVMGVVGAALLGLVVKTTSL